MDSVEIFEFLEPERNRKVDDIVKVLTEQEQALLDKMLVNPVILGTTPPSDEADCQVTSRGLTCPPSVARCSARPW